VRVVGVDGCRGGWLAAAVSGPAVSWSVRTTFDDVLTLAAGDPVGVDMPLGPLPDDGVRRRSDLAARTFLGPARSSIFFTPPASALARWRADPVHPLGIGVSVQTWNLLPKIAEIADTGAAGLLEVHPECSFRALAPGVDFASKKTAAGREQRVAVLGARFTLPAAGSVPARFVEDALDATAVAWTVARQARGEAVTLPPDPAPGEPVIVV
jgi:predicted RNase H-like nuclease